MDHEKLLMYCGSKPMCHLSWTEFFFQLKILRQNFQIKKIIFLKISGEKTKERFLRWNLSFFFVYLFHLPKEHFLLNFQMKTTIFYSPPFLIINLVYYCNIFFFKFSFSEYKCTKNHLKNFYYRVLEHFFDICYYY